MEVVPVGRTNRDIKAREKIIKEFYVKWISEHPDKRIWNMSLGSFINVKFLSINETYEKAARDYDSTHAVLRLTEILGGAVKISEQPSKRDVRNQKQFEKMIIMRYDKVKLVVGLQRSTQEYVQYSITVPSRPNTNKATTKK